MSSPARDAVRLSPRRYLNAALAVASFLLAVTLARPSSAYPFMIKHGFAQCASCHEDPMGGETLTGFGRVMSDTTLSTRWDGSEDPTDRAKLVFAVTEPRWLRLGGSVRYMTLLHKFSYEGSKSDTTNFPMQLDAYGTLRFGPVRVGGSLGYASVPTGSSHARAAQVTSNESGERPPNLISRTHWLGVDIGEHMLLRAGRINLPFGIRMPEHTMWVRSETRTDRESDQDHGLALAYYSGALRGELMAVAGNYQVSPDRYRERGYSLSAEYLLGTRAGIGLSSLVTYAKADRVLGVEESNTRQAHGLTGRFGPMDAISILAEADLLVSTQTSTKGYVGMLQGDFEFVQGLHGMVTGELRDAGKGLDTSIDARPGAGEPQFGSWLSLNWFFLTHFDARVDLVVHQKEPTTIQSQIHGYL